MYECMSTIFITTTIVCLSIALNVSGRIWCMHKYMCAAVSVVNLFIVFLINIMVTNFDRIGTIHVNGGDWDD